MKQDATEIRKRWFPWDGGHLEPGWPVKADVGDAQGNVEYQRDGLTFVRWDHDDEFTYGFKPGDLLILSVYHPSWPHGIRWPEDSPECECNEGSGAR